jgi:hypothetical protein
MPQKMKRKLESALQGRFETTDYKGKCIVVLSYAFCTREEAWELSNYFDAWISKQAPKSVRLLVDLEKANYDPAHSNHLKKTLGSHDSFIKRSAIVNVSPFMTSLVSTMRNFTDFIGVPLKNERGILFSDRNTALEWLVERDRSTDNN